MRRLLLCLLVVAALAGCSGAEEPRGESKSQPPAPIDASITPPPDGMSLVGMDGLAVAVPDDWVVQSSACGGQGRRSILAANPSRHRLVVDSVCITSGRLTLDAIKSMEHVEVDGLAVMGNKGPQCAKEVCHLIFSVPSDQVVFRVGIRVDGGYPEPGALDRIRDSLRQLSEGYTTVPPIAPGSMRSEFATAIEEAGLDPYANHPDSDFKVYGTSPPPGAVLNEGSKVNLLWRSPKRMSLDR